jgi:glycerate 2-kinase
LIVPSPAAATLLRDLYQAMVAAADPMQVVPAHLPPPPRGRTVVVGVGKAAASMARAVEENWSGPLSGVVVVPPGASLPLRRLRVVEGSHPVPDERSVAAAHELMSAVAGLSADDLVLALISGGGSALCALPAAGLELAEKQRITRELLRRGATIAQFNAVRRHLSAIKGGRLALRAHPAPVVSLVISDIPGDDPSLVASGPTLGDRSTCADALAILRGFDIDPGKVALAALESGAWEGLRAAAGAARHRGYACHVLSDAMEGEAREIAKAHAAIARCIADHGAPFSAPCVVLSGGEATVTVRGQGKGGRNTEFALALALEFAGDPRLHALSAGTDGLDGNAGAAGAFIGPDTLERARHAGVDAAGCLRENDSATVFAAIDALVRTGPTHTNINDFRAILIN